LLPKMSAVVSLLETADTAALLLDAVEINAVIAPLSHRCHCSGFIRDLIAGIALNHAFNEAALVWRF